jgi:hypothetical protein
LATTSLSATSATPAPTTASAGKLANGNRGGKKSLPQSRRGFFISLIELHFPLCFAYFF